METIVFRIGSKTDPQKAGIALAENLIKGRKVVVDAIGILAMTICVKSLIAAQARLTTRKINVAFNPFYADILTPENEVKTTVRWEVIKLN